MAKFPTAARVLDEARPKNHAPFNDEMIIAQCEQCREERRLSECAQEETDTARNYRCSRCGDILVIIRAPGDFPIPDSGYRIDKWVFANAVDVRLEGYDRLRFPAMMNATTVEIRKKNRGDVDGSSG